MPIAESKHHASPSQPLSLSPAQPSVPHRSNAQNHRGSVTAAERQARWGHRGGVLELTGPRELLDAIERSLLIAGAGVVRLDANNSEFAISSELLDAVTALQTRAGLLTLLVRIEPEGVLTAHTANQSILIDASQPDFAPATAVAAVHRLLYEAGILLSPEWFGEGAGI